MARSSITPIVISGLAGSGKSTVAKKVADELGLEYRSGGNYMRELAKDLNINIDNGDFQKYRESNEGIDYKLDRMQFDSLRKGNIVLESRFGALYHPFTEIKGLELFRVKLGIRSTEIMKPGSVLSIFLFCDDEERYRRISKRNGKPVEVVRKDEQARHQADVDLYKMMYNLDPFNFEHSEYLIEATRNSAEVNAESIINRYKMFTKKT